MASSAVEGGLNALHKLGSTDIKGVSKRDGSRSWCTNDNGNPANMLTFVRNLMGQDDDVLFIVERDINRNVVFYRPALTSTGELDTSLVAGGSWLIVADEADLDNTTEEMVDEQLVEEELTRLERLGYGVKRVSGPELIFSIAALPDTPLTLFQNEEGAWRVWVEIEGDKWIVQRIMLHTQARMLGMFPQVTEVHFDVESTCGLVAQFYFAV